MDWVIWVLLMVPLGVPVGSLVIDRIWGIPARKQWVLLGLPALALFAGALAYAAAAGDPIVQLVGWGALAGVLGTILLDLVRLIGVRLGTFPLDMPELFGTIGLGLVPRFQRNMMKEMVAQTAASPDPQRRMMLEPRLKALAGMPSQRRQAVMAGMMSGLAELPEEGRQTMLQTQMGILSDLPGEQRRALMATMDAVMAGADGAGPLPYRQPRGMPRIPMATFRRMAERGLPRTRREAGVSLGAVRATGYFWHFVMGAVSLGIPYTLLVGQGPWGWYWGLALGWGTFVWLAMMLLMPPMMPMIRFPWWFPVVPFFAHIAFAVPFALVGQYLVGDAAHLHSLLGALS